MSEQKPPRYKPYNQPAGGWGAAGATAKVLLQQSVIGKGSKALLAMNQPGGFKCPSCAFPDADERKKLEFCENGAKALAWEATQFRAGRELFAQHTVTELMAQTDYWLEMQGRLTEPMRYDAATDHYVPCSWDEAFALIGRHLQALDSPHQAEFYTSGRTPNEAAFLYSIFVREFGTNNFPDCSNMCHEPTSRGLPPAIGVGKGTIVLQDFEHAEAIFVVGQNTGTNSPRMMSNLVEARKRGIPIVAVNPMPERALIRFAEPQDMVQMATFGSTEITSEFVHIRIGGDLALIKGMMKVMFEREAQGKRVLDHDFLSEHTVGLEALREDVMAQDWDEIVQVSGISQAQIRRCAEIYIRSKATVICYGMGLTQHQYGSCLLQQVANLLLLRGNFGKPGAGIGPIRGHSNVQGDRTVGIDEKPKPAYLDRVQQVFGFDPPREHGHHVVESIEAMLDGSARVFIGLGGNFIHAVPDTPRAYEAMRGLDLTVGIATKLNRGHLVHGRDALILPVVARSERIVTPAGEQFVTIEDAMSNVTASRGVLEPVSTEVLPEVEIVCRMADGRTARQQGRLGAVHARLCAHPRSDRCRVPGDLHRLQRAHPAATRFPSGHSAAPPRLAHAEWQGQHPGDARPGRGRSGARSGHVAVGHRALARPVQHHHLQLQRPLSRRVQRSHGAVHEHRGPAGARTAEGGAGQPGDDQRRWRAAAHRGPDRAGLPDAARRAGRLLPGAEPVVAAGLLRPHQRHARRQVDSGAGAGDGRGDCVARASAIIGV